MLRRVLGARSLVVPRRVGAAAMVVRRRGLATAAAAPAAAAPRTATVARFERHGNPADVIQVHKNWALPAPEQGDVVVKLLAAPINPADLNMIEGTYKSLPKLPSNGGNEGVFEVVDTTTTSSNNLSVGDWVIPKGPSSTTMPRGGGTWATAAVWRADQLERVPSLPPTSSRMTRRAWLDSVATVAVNPCTAYRMLHDFVALKRGDVVVQNGATSGVGQAVIQIAHALGVRTVNVIRDADPKEGGGAGGAKATAEWLRGLGADVVLTESELDARKPMTAALEALNVQSPVLALNCVSGASATNLLRFLKRAPLVTYGGMSKKPITVPTAALIFNDISLRGFWLSEWVATHSAEERMAMIRTVLDMQLQTFTEHVPVSDIVSVLNGKRSASATPDGIRRKVLLVPGSD